MPSWPLPILTTHPYPLPYPQFFWSILYSAGLKPSKALSAAQKPTSWVRRAHQLTTAALLRKAVQDEFPLASSSAAGAAGTGGGGGGGIRARCSDPGEKDEYDVVLGGGARAEAAREVAERRGEEARDPFAYFLGQLPMMTAGEHNHHQARWC